MLCPASGILGTAEGHPSLRATPTSFSPKRTLSQTSFFFGPPKRRLVLKGRCRRYPLPSLFNFAISSGRVSLRGNPLGVSIGASTQWPHFLGRFGHDYGRPIIRQVASILFRHFSCKALQIRETYHCQQIRSYDTLTRLSHSPATSSVDPSCQRALLPTCRRRRPPNLGVSGLHQDRHRPRHRRLASFLRAAASLPPLE